MITPAWPLAPWGNRALLTARKASEIVIFTLRTLHLSRLAMLSVVAVCSAISSLRRYRYAKARKVKQTSMKRKQNGSKADKPWHFKEGNKLAAGIGRPAGMPNRMTRQQKDAVMLAAALSGDVDLIPALTARNAKAKLRALMVMYDQTSRVFLCR